jgi:hypothetical protein
MTDRITKAGHPKDIGCEKQAKKYKIKIPRVLRHLKLFSLMSALKKIYVAVVINIALNKCFLPLIQQRVFQKQGFSP